MSYFNKKLESDPAQHELARLLIGVVEGRCNATGILNFMNSERWSKIEQADRLRHALSLVKNLRGELYRNARQVCQLIYRTF